jgi:phosphatidylserine/phosphatidylglycerophosphate/cardiolipin synthase-like enzyme
MYGYYLNMIRILSALSLAVILSACSTVTIIEEQQQILPRVIAGNDLNCPVTDLSHCSIPSPIQDLASKYFTDLESGDPEQYADILNIGEKALEVRIHLIRAAKTSIDIQTYIWKSDESGGLIARELIAAAKRGVRVRIIGDQLFSGNDAKRLAATAQLHENLQIKLYNPLNQKAASSGMDMVKGFFTNFKGLNHRMHNKVMVFDGRIAITGGRNIANEYYDRNTEFNFVDRDILVIGLVAEDMEKSFERYWVDPITFDLDQLLDVREYLFIDNKQQILPTPEFSNVSGFEELISRALDYDYINDEFVKNIHSLTDIEFIADRPQKPFIEDDKADIDTSKSIGLAIRNADHSILMQTPYFIISRPAYQMFKELREEKPDIEYSLSTNSLASADHYFVYALSFKRKKRNVKNLKFRMHEFKPRPADVEKFIPGYSELEKLQPPPDADGMYEYEPEEAPGLDLYDTVPIETKGPRASIHSKSMVIDNEIAIIGSHNFDPRGVAINTEVTVTITDKEFAAELADDIRLAMQPQNSWTIAKRQQVPLLGHITGIVQSISRMLPIFDIWPFRYTSSFELREGMAPVPIDDPEFYNHYENVGQFPGTGSNNKQISTRLISGFGAVAEPLM